MLIRNDSTFLYVKFQIQKNSQQELTTNKSKSD